MGKLEGYVVVVFVGNIITRRHMKLRIRPKEVISTLQSGSFVGIFFVTVP